MITAFVTGNIISAQNSYPYSKYNTGKDYKDPVTGEKYDPELVDIIRKYSNTPPTKISSLSLSPDDVRWEASPDGTYIDLVVRKKRQINSILLTNVYRGKENQMVYGVKAYGLRAVPYDHGFDAFFRINGNESRLWKRKFIGRKQNLYFLVDSTPEKHPYFGLAFRIRIPKHVEFGYVRAGENHGYISVMKSVMLNLRTFSRKYADYNGKFADNFFVVQSDAPEAPIRPKLDEISRKDDGDFVSVHVRYTSPSSRYFKKFIIRKSTPQNIMSEQYEEVGYVFDATKEHMKAKFLSSTFIQGKGKVVEALIFFKKGEKPQTYYISAFDEKDLQTENQIKVMIPSYSYGYHPATSTPEITPPSSEDDNITTEFPVPDDSELAPTPEFPEEPPSSQDWDIQFND